MSRLLLDAGAFVAFDRGDVRLRARLTAALRLGDELITSSPIVAQVWRSGRKALLAALLQSTRVDAPDAAHARRAGILLARTKTKDVVDALLVGLAGNGDTILTSDPDDLTHLVEAARVRVAIVRV